MLFSSLAAQRVYNSQIKGVLKLIRSAVRLCLQTHDFPSESACFVTAFVTHFNYQT